MRALYRNPGALKSATKKKLKGNAQEEDSQPQVASSSAASVCKSQEQNLSERCTERDGDDPNSDFSNDFIDNGMGHDVDSDDDLFGDDGPDDPDSPDESQGSESEGLGEQPRKYSVGKSHGAFVSLGKAKATVARAHNLIEHQSNLQQDIARVVFSHYGRGNNVGNRHLYRS